MNDFRLYFITNSIDDAEKAISAGCSKIFIDLEKEGKFERQGHLDTFISKHNIDDVSILAKKIANDKILVRINPLSDKTELEINKVVESGAGSIMLPMYSSASHVSEFVRLINKRCKAIILLENESALKCIDETLEINGIDEIHIGLNDLKISIGSKFMFEPLTNGTLDHLCGKIRNKGIPFGIGGIARYGEGLIPAQLLISEHVRLGSDAAILSRTFNRSVCDKSEILNHTRFHYEIERLQSCYKRLKNVTQYELDVNNKKIDALIKEIISI